jgi:Fe-Mn family superoxide dismutase
MPFTLPELPYAYDALQPHMSKETLEFHHDKHHKAYLDAMTEMIEGTDYAAMSIEEIVKKSHTDNPKLFNQAAQYYNHIYFWKWMAPDGGGQQAPGKLGDRINRDFGSFFDFRRTFIEAGRTQFGSGWAWLALNGDNLVVMSTPNGENPIVHGAKPLLGVDVWEHSYYLDYRNHRLRYLEVWFDSLINWDYVAELYEQG